MKVVERKLKTEIQDHFKLKTIDFEDTFATVNRQDNLLEITKLIFDNSPKWVSWLMALRNTLVKFIGLQTEKPSTAVIGFKEGEYIGFFQIMSIQDNDIVLGADDSHLNFRAIISCNSDQEYNIDLTTLVEFNNKTGRIYFSLIKPFHKIVVKHMLKQAYKKDWFNRKNSNVFRS